MNDIDDTDKKLAYSFVECEAENRSLLCVIEHLRTENNHLRDMISLLLQTIQSFSNN